MKALKQKSAIIPFILVLTLVLVSLGRRSGKRLRSEKNY